ncbi:MAG: AraC family transcriptional regulator [Pseudomonadota bacterium]
MDTRAKVLHWKDRSHRFTPHFHTEFYAGAIVRGCCEFEAGGQPHAAHAGDLVLINPFEVHTAGCSPDVEYRAVYFDDLPGVAARADGDGAQFLSFTGTVVPASPLARRLAEALSEPAQGEALTACLQDILEAHTAQKAPPLDMHDFQRRVVAELERDGEDQGTPAIADVAARLGMSAQHFSRAFHRVFGVPAVFFRNQLRVHRAEAQLRQGGRPAEVAVECGFSDQAHLIREFKKMRGVTPKLYATAYHQLA